MKKLIFVILLISLTFAGYSQTVTSLGVSGAYYDIKTDNSGAVHIIWIDLTGWAHYGQIVNRQVVNQVTIPGLARNEINYRKFRPRIAVRPDGNEVHFSWVTPVNYPTQFMHAWKNSSGVWNRETIYSAPSNTYLEYPAVTVDSAGVTHASCITWKDGVSSHAVIYLRKAVGGSWVRQTDISPATTKQLWITMFTDTSGNVHMTWDSNDKRYINYRTAPSGGNLASSSTTTLGTNWDHNKESDVFVDSSGNVHVAALSYNDPGSYVGFDYWSKAVGSGFSSPVTVTPSQFYVSRYFPHPVVIGNTANVAAVSWAEGVLGTPMEIHVATYDGNSWTQYTLDTTASFNEWSKTALALNSTTAFCIWRSADKTISLATFDFASSGLISPNGGEEWGFSKTYDIKWNLDNATGNVDINLFKNDVDLGPIVSDIADSGSYSWTIDTLESGSPIASGTDYKVEVAARNGSDSDISQAEFSILPSIDITAPLAGVNWGVGSTQEITWTKTGTQDNFVNIILFKSSTAVLNIATGVDNSGTYTWDVPLSTASGDDYSIRVETADGVVQDDSGAFSIMESIDITSPTAGTEWVHNQSHTITWDVYGLMNDSVKIRLWKGSTRIDISNGTPNDGSFSWTIPSSLAEGSDYYVLVKTADGLVSDESELMSIVAEVSTPTIFITSPDSGSDWLAGSTQNITWDTSGAMDSNVKVELYKGGSFNSTISSSTANDGNFSWSIDGGQASGSDYTIKVTTLDGQVADDSPQFNISYTAPDITITSPATGVTWIRGNTYSVNWNTAGSLDANVKIELIKGSSLNSTIIASTPNDGSFSWAIPSGQVMGTDYLVRITTLDDQVTDDSGVFIISEQTVDGIVVTSPSAGEQWIRSQTYNITWNVTGSLNNSVKIRLWRGSTRVDISNGTPNDGSFTWTVPSSLTQASDYFVRIKTADALYYDDSDLFYIGAASVTPTITITSPASGADWQAGSTQAISWNTSGTMDSNVKVELYKGGSLNSTISSSTSNDGSFSWPINGGQAAGSDYTIKITTLDGQVADDSPQFTISYTAPDIAITSPAAGVTWNRGNNYSVNWNTAGTLDANVKIELIKGGSLNSTITSSTPNDGSFSWPIPSGQVMGTDYLVRVTTLDDQVTDDSGIFTISEQLEDGIVVTSPYAGEQLIHDQPHNITWNITGSLNNTVKIRLWRGSTRFDISDGTPNDGSFTWTPPSSLAQASDYYVLVKTADALYSDTSDLFYIGPQASDPTITVTAPISSSKWVTGQTYAVTWNTTGTQDANVKIDLYKGGSLDSSIAASTPNSGSYSWTIDGGQTLGTDYVVRVTTLDDQVTDDSEQFEITDTVPATSLEVTSPDNSSYLNAGTSTAITWSITGDQNPNVNIYLYDNGSFHSNIALSTPNDGSFNWPISSGINSSSRYSVRVETVDSVTSDDSQLFVIFGIGLTVGIPQAGDTFVKGSSVNIQWKAVGNMNSNVKIRVWGGPARIDVSDGTPNDGSFTWTVPASLTNGSSYFVRVKTADGLFSDDSDLFRIADAGINVTSPSTNNVLNRGSQHTINWASAGSMNSNVKIGVYQGGTQIYSITGSTSNDGSHTWTVPSDITLGNNFFVRVETIDDLVSDDSGLFTIED